MSWTFIIPQEVYIPENLLDIQPAKFLWCHFCCSNEINFHFRKTLSSDKVSFRRTYVVKTTAPILSGAAALIIPWEGIERYPCFCAIFHCFFTYAFIYTLTIFKSFVDF